tara:strand:+ start:1107 stop:1856 length:750 start_codon:yes stop_codon:yes gene_type:complete
MTQRYFLYISFNGNKYHGWQKQINSITIQHVIQDSINKFFRQKIEVVGAGRTDTGVHANEMVAHIDLAKVNIDNFLYRLNSVLPDDIKVFKMIHVNKSAHARFDAVKRCYRYYIVTKKDPFRLGTSWLFSKELDFQIMDQACKILLKNKDFKSFEKSHSGASNSICELYDIGFQQEKDLIIFNICANRFLRNMVRSILGTLIMLGEGKINLNKFIVIINSRDRSSAGHSVPASGLFLHKISYSNSVFVL